MKKLLIFFVALFLVHVSARAQLNQFSNPTAAPLHFNPAFVGSIDQQRLAFAYSHGWLSYPTGIRTGYASYDQVSNRLHGALGAEVYIENYADSLLSGSFDARFSGVYAAKFNLGSNWTLSPALKVGYQDRRIKVFGCDSPGCDPTYIDFNRKSLNFSPGILINSPAFYFGVQSELLGSIRLQETSLFDPIGYPRSFRIWKFQTGYHFQPKGRPWSLAATGVVMTSQIFVEYIAQLMYNRKWLLAGVGYVDSSYPNSLSFSVGYKHRLFRAMGVYDYHLNNLGQSHSGGSFELSLMFYLQGQKSSSSSESPSIQ